MMIDLIEAAKVIQPYLEKVAGEGGGARVWLSEPDSLHALIWTRLATNLGPVERQKFVWRHMLDISPVSTLELIPTRMARKISQITVLTPNEYEEQYFFTKPPFCEEG